jgi:anti-anti-sigma factor
VVDEAALRDQKFGDELTDLSAVDAQGPPETPGGRISPENWFQREIAMASGTSDRRRPLTITTEPISAHGSSIAVEGELDIGGIDELRDAIASQISRGHSHLVFDLSDTAFLDCAAIGQLMVSIAPLRDDPRAAVVLLGPRGRVRRLLELIHFERVMPIAHDRAAAIDLVHSETQAAAGWRKLR